MEVSILDEHGYLVVSFKTTGELGDIVLKNGYRIAEDGEVIRISGSENGELQ